MGTISLRGGTISLRGGRGGIIVGYMKDSRGRSCKCGSGNGTSDGTDGHGLARHDYRRWQTNDESKAEGLLEVE